MAINTINRYGDNASPPFFKLFKFLLIQVKLLTATRTPIEWIKNQHQRSSPIILESDAIAIRIWQLEIRRGCANRQRCTFGWTLHLGSRLVQISNILKYQTV